MSPHVSPDVSRVMKVAARPSIVMVEGRGSWIWDADDKRYLDFVQGWAVNCLGHSPRVIVEALESQARRLINASPAFYNEPMAKLATLIAEASGLGDVFLCNSGAEANEGAIKLARKWGARHRGGAFEIITMEHAFHGRTLATMTLTGKVQPYKAGFGPMLPDVFHVPYPVAYHGVTPEDSLAALDQLFKADVDPERVAAIIIEPVQGEGGFYAAPPQFLRTLRALCDRHGMLLIADEIQSGFARTGRVFAIEHAGVEPDLITVAKSVAGGLPLSGVIGKAAIMDAPPPGGLGGTYAGSPLACAAGLAVLDIIAEEKLCERASHIGDVLRTRLAALQQRFPAIGDVRGPGAMVAMELVQKRDPHQPDAELTKALVQAAAKRGLVILSCGVYANVIRFLAPLTISDALLAEGLDCLEAALNDLAGATAAVA